MSADFVVYLKTDQGPAGPPGLSPVNVVEVLQQALVTDAMGNLVRDKDGDIVFAAVSDP